MKYLTLAVASDAEADRLIEDLLEHPGEPLRSPYWGNAVHAKLELPAPAGRASAEPLRPARAGQGGSAKSGELGWVRPAG